MLEVSNENSAFGIIKKLINSPFTFHLTGSHFFGTANGNSDIDFFVELPSHLDSNQVQLNDFWSFLEGDLGMHRVNGEGSYSERDLEVAHVFQTTFVSPPIHIQVVLDAEIKVIAQDMMKTLGVVPDKRRGSYLWEKAYDYARKLDSRPKLKQK